MQQLLCGFFRISHPAAAGQRRGKAACACNVERSKIGFIGAFKAGRTCGRGLCTQKRLRSRLCAVLGEFDNIERGTARQFVQINGKVIALVKCLEFLQHLPLFMRLCKPVRHDNAEKPQRAERQDKKNQIFHARSAHSGSS